MAYIYNEMGELRIRLIDGQPPTGWNTLRLPARRWLCVPRPRLPPGSDRDVYLVLDSFGSRLGRAWVETDEEDTDRDTLLRHLMEGQYSNPVRIVSFNTVEGWSRDASEEIAAELRQRCAERGEVPEPLETFLGRYGAPPALQLVLPIRF